MKTMQSSRRLSISRSAVSLFVLACLIAAAGWLFFDDQAAAQQNEPANQPPKFIHAVKRGVNENSPAGTNVGAPVTASDPDGDAIAYSLSGAGSELFTIDGNGQIKVGAETNLDHETTPSYAVTVHADDGKGGTDSVPITINVRDVDETEYPPKFIHAVQRGVDENSPAGTNVGAPVTARDPNGDAITYSLSGSGSELFTIDDGGQIKVGEGTELDHEATPSYAVTVHASDGKGGTASVNITINVRDVEEEEEETAGAEELPAVSVVRATGGPESGSLTFGLERTGDASEALTVNVGISETGSMLAANPPTAADFAAGSATTTLSVELDDDDVDEADSTVTLTALSGDGYTVSGASAAAIVTDDDLPTVIIEADSASVSEAAGPATFTLTRNGVLSETLTVNVGISETESMLADTQPATAIFAANSATATLPVTLDDDAVDEADSVVTATVAAGDGYDVGNPSSATITVTDDDLPEVALSTVISGLVGNVGQPAATAIGSASDVAQAFTTGSNAGGYALEGVDVGLTIGSNAAAPGTMRLLSDNNGSPGDLIQTFNAPASYATGLNAYATRAAAVILSPDTTYWLSWDNSQAHDHTLSATTSDAEDAGGTAGWSIGNTLHTKGRDSGAWAADADSRAVKFRLKGRASAAPAGVTLVRNLGQPSVGRLSHSRNDNDGLWHEFDVATSFRTGSAPGGYTLTGVKLDFAVYDHSNRNPDLALRIFTHNEGQVYDYWALKPTGNLLSTLLLPARVAAGVNEFRVPGGGLALDPDTTYWVVFDREYPSIHYPKATSSTAEDAGGSPDWSIGDRVLLRVPRDFYSSWGAYDNSMLMELVGYAGQPVVTIAAEPASVSEAGGQATFTLTRHEGLISESLTVNVAISETGGSMLPASAPATAIFAANSATATLTVDLVDDSPIMSHSEVTATVQSGNGYVVGSQSSASVTVTDDDGVWVTIEADQPSVSEGAGQTDFTLRRTGNLSQRLDVNVAVSESGGNRLAPGQPSTATFAANSATAPFTVTLVDDALIAPDSVVTATVQDGNGYMVVSPSAAEITVIDNDTTVLTGNTGQSAATAVGSGSDVAQAFTTGSNAGGYALTGVDIGLTVGSNSARPGILRLMADRNGAPGQIIQTFNDPATRPAGYALRSYTPRTAAYFLSPDTTYWLMWDNFQPHDHTLSATTSDNEGAGLAGWSIGNVLHTRGQGGGAWTADADSRAALFRLQGNAATAPAGGKLAGNRGASPMVTLPWTGSHDYATSFTTGSHPDGYVLTGLTLDMATDIAHGSSNGTDLAVSIRADNGGEPAHSPLAALLPPAQVGVMGAEYRVPGAGLELSPSTTYWVYLDNLVVTSHRVKATTSDAEDADSAAGWSIGYTIPNRGHNVRGNYVIHRNHALAMELKGLGGAFVTIAADQTSVSEADGQATFTLTRTGDDLSQGLTVNVSVAETGGSMLAASQPAVATFAANSATATLTVSLVDDAPIMSNSVVTATVQSGDGYAVGSASAASVTVTDDDAVRVTIEADNASVSEADGQATFTLTRTGGDHSGGLTANVAISETGGSMLPASAPTTAIFAANSATATLTVSLVDDAPIALDSIVTATVQSGDGYAVGSTSAASVTVIDDEPSTVTIQTDQANVSEADGQATFTLSRAGNLSRELTVNVAVSEDQAMLGDNQPATAFFAANSATTTLTVELHDDEVSEPSSIVTATVQSVVGYTVGSSASATVTVTDDEGPTVTIEADNASVSEADGQATFTLTRTGDVSQGLTVNVAVSESGGNMLASRQPTVATFMANSATAQLIARLVNDSVGEMDSEVTATVEAGGGYEVGSPSEATVTVTDDEGPTVTIVANSLYINESAGEAYFTVSRMGNVGDGRWMVSFDVSETENVVKWSEPIGTKFFSGSNAIELTVPLDDDETDEPASVITVTLLAGSRYTVGSQSSATVIVSDND